MMVRGTIMICVRFYTCVHVERRHMGVDKHTCLLNLTTVPKWLRRSVAPSHSTMCLPPPLALSFLFLPAAKGKKTRSCSSSPSSTLPLQPSTQCCRGARAEGSTQQGQMSRQWEHSCLLEEWEHCLGLSAWSAGQQCLGKLFCCYPKQNFGYSA